MHYIKKPSWFGPWKARDPNPSASIRFMHSTSPFHFWAPSFLICTLKGLHLKTVGPLSSKPSSWVVKVEGCKWQALMQSTLALGAHRSPKAIRGFCLTLVWAVKTH